MKKRMAVLGLCMALAAVLPAGCGSNDSYNDYKQAYQAMSAPGSLHAGMALTLTTPDSTVNADGNMKINQAGDLYYEMSVGDTQVVQFLKDGIMYSEIDGIKTTYDVKNRGNQKPVTEGGSPEKEEGTGFELQAFLEEFATVLEAGKIKEMGLLDPIPREVIKKITVAQEDGGKIYQLEMPDSFIEKLFNVMIEEQVSDQSYALSFSNLKDFVCMMHVNADGVLDGMKYAGKTDVTVPAALTGSAQETISMEITLQVDILDAGKKIEVEIPAPEGF